MIDEHAGELVADRLVDQHRRDRAVDAAGQPADHPAPADLLADVLDRLVLEGAHRPVAAALRDLAHEIAEQRRALRRVHHFEMELRGVELALVVRDHGDRRVLRGADHAEALRQLGDAVAVAHPDRIALALLPHALEQRGVLGDQHLGAAELAMMPRLDLAAELVRHRLLAVADAEHRHAGVEQFLGGERRALSSTEAGPPDRITALGFIAGEGFGRLLVRHDLGIDLLFAHPARDELRHLGAEIDDENLVVQNLVVRVHGGF